MDSLPLKTCPKCRQEQPRENYHKCARSKDRLQCLCKECNRARVRAWHKANPEKAKAKQDAYRAANPGKGTERQKAYYKANPEKAKAWRENNPERFKALKKAWRAANPENVRAFGHRRRALERSAEGSYTVAEWKAKLKLYKGRCHWCSQKIKGVTHADHVIPLSKGGSNYAQNIVPSCAKCNQTKNAKLPHEFIGRLF